MFRLEKYLFEKNEAVWRGAHRFADRAKRRVGGSTFFGARSSTLPASERGRAGLVLPRPISIPDSRPPAVPVHSVKTVCRCTVKAFHERRVLDGHCLSGRALPAPRAVLEFGEAARHSCYCFPPFFLGSLQGSQKYHGDVVQRRQCASARAAPLAMLQGGCGSQPLPSRSPANILNPPSFPARWGVSAAPAMQPKAALAMHAPRNNKHNQTPLPPTR